MKHYLFILFIAIVLLNSCKSDSGLSFTKKPQQVIAFQPLDDFNGNDIDSVVKQVALFYNKRVIVLKAIKIPATFFNHTLHQYSADSIIGLLSQLRNDTLAEIVGLTHKPVYTIKNAKPVPYFDQYVFGMGYQPGNACVVSDLKFTTGNSTVFNHRLKTVIIHEVGHNLGLPHCPDAKCIMSKNNGNLAALDTCGNDYCAACKKLLGVK